LFDEKSGAVFIALGIVTGLLGGSWILGHAIEQMRGSERFVTVRGVSEKMVNADLAVWPIKVRVAGNNLSETTQAADVARGKVLIFLTGNGMSSSDIVSQNLHVSDRQTSNYVEKGVLRYLVEYTILVRSQNVENVRKISQMTDKLVAAGVGLSSQGDWDKSTPVYLFTKLNEVKPGMMAEATHSARQTAEQFAADSGSVVGPIRRASQGLFSITNRDQAAHRDGDGVEAVGAAASDTNKKIRVVVTVDYLLLNN
jgi:hypothetical protein